MALNIKDESIHQSARELADLKGVSLTEAVRLALSHELEMEKQRMAKRERPLAERLTEIAERCAGLPDLDDTPIQPGQPASSHDWLYDENGLPV